MSSRVLSSERLNETGAQRAVVDRGALPPDPRCVEHAVAAGRHARRDLVEDLEHVRLLRLGEQFVLVVEHVVAQPGEVAAGRRLQRREQPAAGQRARHRRDAANDVGLLERHVRGEPGRRAQVQVHGEVAGGAGADGRGRGVDGAGDDLRLRRQPELVGRGRRQPAEYLGALDDLGQLARVDAAVTHERGIVPHAVGVAVVGHPAGHDRVVARRHAAGELEVQVVRHAEELVRARVHLRQLVADVEHVRRRVLAGRRGHAAGELHPAADARQADAVQAERPAELPPQVRRAAHVHPEEAVREWRAGLVHRHRALALRAAADGGDPGGRTVVTGKQSPRRGDHGPPPVLRPLLRAAARQHDELDRLELPRGNAPVEPDQRDLGAGGAEVDGEDVAGAARGAGHCGSIAPAPGPRGAATGSRAGGAPRAGRRSRRPSRRSRRRRTSGA